MRSNLRNEMLRPPRRHRGARRVMAYVNHWMIGFALAFLLAATTTRADFGHDGPLPHALSSDLAAEVERLESSAEAARRQLAEVDSELNGELDVTIGRLDVLQERIESLAECCETPAAIDLPSWLLWLGCIGAALLLGLGAWTAFLASRLRKLSRNALDSPNAPESTRSRVPVGEDRPDAASDRPDTDGSNATNTEEKSKMAERETTESKLRFEIRLAQNGEPYFAIVATSNGQVLMKSESYASGMRALEHAMGRVRREAYGAAEKDRREEGPIGDASPED